MENGKQVFLYPKVIQLKMVSKENKASLFIILVVFLLSGCSVEKEFSNKDIFKERNVQLGANNSIKDLHQGINIIKEEPNVYIFGAYVNGENIIYFEALRGDKNSFIERLFFSAPTYGIDTVIKDQYGDPFSISFAGQHSLSQELMGTPALASGQLFESHEEQEEAMIALRSTSVEMVKELSGLLKERNILSSSLPEKEALLIHTQGIKRTLEEDQTK